MGRPSTITLKVDKEELRIADKKIKQVLRTTIRGFNKSGGYIPMSQDYNDHEAFVIVLEK